MLRRRNIFQALFVLPRMWCRGNTPQPAVSVRDSICPGVVVATILALLSIVEPAPGQIPAPLVDESHARRAFRIVQVWLEAGMVSDADLPTMRVRGLMGLRLTLRDQGIVMGGGQAYRPDIDAAINAPDPPGSPGSPGKPIDLVGLLKQATTEALIQVQHKLADARARAIQDGRSVRPAEPLAHTTSRLQLDLQLAHRLHAVNLAAQAHPDAVLGTFAPGYHGLRLLRHDRKSSASDDALLAQGSFIWPASALAANTQPRSQITRLLNDQGYLPKDRAKLARPDGPRLQRFEVIHMVRPQGDQSPKLLVRGNVVLAQHSVNEAQLTRITQQLAHHLAKRYVDSGQWRSTYHPTSQRYHPAIANAQEAALAGFALAHYARVMQRLTGKPPADAGATSAHESALQLGQAVLNAKANQAHGPGASTAALVLLTLVDSIVPSDNQMLRDQLGSWLLELRNDDGGFRSSADPDAKPVNQATGAVIVAALAGLYDQTRNQELAGAAAASLEALWKQSRDNPNVLALYWLAMAQRSLESWYVQPDHAGQNLADRQREFVGLLEKLCEQQIIERPNLGPMDVMGGFELFKAPRGSPPSPDWRSAPLLGFLAVCLGDENLTDQSKIFDWLVTGVLAARFIDQLMFNKQSCYYVRSPETVLGGVRRSLWDNRLDIAPSAMSLLAVVELQESIARIKSFSAAPPPPGSPGSPV